METYAEMIEGTSTHVDCASVQYLLYKALPLKAGLNQKITLFKLYPQFFVDYDENMDISFSAHPNQVTLIIMHI